jgi:hypothetical protein
MISQEKEEIIERMLFGRLTSEDQKQFERWMAEDLEFKETFEFRKHLGAQLRLKHRNELKQTFKQIREEMKLEETVEKEAVVLPFWRKSWFRAVASVVLLLGIFWIINDKLTTYNNKQKAMLAIIDSLQATIDSLSLRASVDLARTSTIRDSLQKASPKLTTVHPKIQELPLYETNDVSLGFGKNEKPSNVLPVLFIPSTQRQYEYAEGMDTLRIYMPASEWNQKWILIYNRSKNQYLLSNSKDNYEITNGLEGKRILKKVNYP